MSHSPTAAMPIPLIRPHIPPWVAVVIACLCSFMVVTDGAIVNVALPSMQAELGLSAVGLQWVVDSYLLMLGGLMLLVARASDLYGRRRVLQTGLAVFTLASLVGGLASSGAMLIAARAVQGMGASALATSTLAVIVAVYPAGAARGRAISVWAASSALASAFGVVVGGLLTAHAGWRWVMGINVPIGLVLMALVSRCLAPVPGGHRGTRMDLPGGVLITVGMAALLYGLSQSASLGWGAAPVVGSLLLAAACLLAFLRVESTVPQPLIRLSVFKVFNVSVGSLAVIGLGAALTASTFFTSLVLQQLLHYDAQQAGLAMLPMALALAEAALLARRMMDGGVRGIPFVGGLVGAAGLLWMGQLSAEATSYLGGVFGPTLLTGTGLGLMLMTATHTALDGVPGNDAGLASGLFNASRQLGAALGIAALSTLAHAVAASHGALAGYRAAFVATAVIAALAGVITLLLYRPRA